MSTSRRRKNQEAFVAPEEREEEEEEEAKTTSRKKNKVVKRKMPKVRRARDGTLHARKEVRSIPEANKLRKAIPAMLRDQVKEFENLAVRLYEIYAHSPHLIVYLPDFFCQRWRDEHKHGWVHTAERTLLGSPQVSFRDSLLLFLNERVPEYFDRAIMAHRNLEISREVVRLLKAAEEKNQQVPLQDDGQDPRFSMRRNVVEMAHAAIETLKAQGQMPDDLQIPLEPTYEVYDPTEEFTPPPPPLPLPSPPPATMAKAEPENDDDGEISEASSELDEDDSLDPDDDHTPRSVKTLSPYQLVCYAYDHQTDRRVVERIVRYADSVTLGRARIFRPKFGLPEEYLSAAEDAPYPSLVKPKSTPWQVVFDLMHVNWNVWKIEHEDMEPALQTRVRQLCEQATHSSWMQYFKAPESTRKMLRDRAGQDALAFWQSFEH